MTITVTIINETMMEVKSQSQARSGIIKRVPVKQVVSAYRNCTIINKALGLVVQYVNGVATSDDSMIEDEALT